MLISAIGLSVTTVGTVWPDRYHCDTKALHIPILSDVAVGVFESLLSANLEDFLPC